MFNKCQSLLPSLSGRRNTYFCAVKYTHSSVIQISLCVFKCWTYIYKGLLSACNMKAVWYSTAIENVCRCYHIQPALCYSIISGCEDRHLATSRGVSHDFPSLCGNAWCRGSLFWHPLLDINFHEWNLIHKFMRVSVLLEALSPWSSGLFIYNHRVLTYRQARVSAPLGLPAFWAFVGVIPGRRLIGRGCWEGGHILEEPWQEFLSILVLCCSPAVTCVWVFRQHTPGLSLDTRHGL